MTLLSFPVNTTDLAKSPVPFITGSPVPTPKLITGSPVPNLAFSVSPVPSDSSSIGDLWNTWSPNTSAESVSSSVLPPDVTYSISEEETSDDMLSWDIVLRLFHSNSDREPHKIVFEVDRPWHYIRVIAAKSIEELSPLSPGLFNSKGRRSLRGEKMILNPYPIPHSILKIFLIQSSSYFLFNDNALLNNNTVRHSVGIKTELRGHDSIINIQL